MGQQLEQLYDHSRWQAPCPEALRTAASAHRVPSATQGCQPSSHSHWEPPQDDACFSTMLRREPPEARKEAAAERHRAGTGASRAGIQP